MKIQQLPPSTSEILLTSSQSWRWGSCVCCSFCLNHFHLLVHAACTMLLTVYFLWFLLVDGNKKGMVKFILPWVSEKQPTLSPDRLWLLKYFTISSDVKWNSIITGGVCCVLYSRCAGMVAVIHIIFAASRAIWAVNCLSQCQVGGWRIKQLDSRQHHHWTINSSIWRELHRGWSMWIEIQWRSIWCHHERRCI